MVVAGDVNAEAGGGQEEGFLGPLPSSTALYTPFAVHYQKI